MIAKRSAESSGPLNDLYDRRSHPEARAVLSDMRHMRGERPGRLGVDLVVAQFPDASDAADADADAAAADAAAAAADADADASDADAADADAAAADARRICAVLTKLLTEEIEMRNGLMLVQVPGRYGYAVTRVGWVRRVAGDELELHGAVTIMRNSGNYALDGLSKLASDGPKRGYEVTKPDKSVEFLHRLTLRRAMAADPKAWAEACPKPQGWDEAIEAST